MPYTEGYRESGSSVFIVLSESEKIRGIDSQFFFEPVAVADGHIKIIHSQG